MKRNQTREITYAQAATIADARTMAALIAIGSPPLEIDENGHVAVLGGMSQTMIHAYSEAYLGQSNGKLWARLGHPLETDSSESNSQTELQMSTFNSVDFLEKSAKRSANRSLFQLTVAIAGVMVLWFSGFNVLITGWLSAYIGTWIISPIAGIVFSVIIYGFHRLLEAIKKIL
jgi:hypothetical protein